MSRPIHPSRATDPANMFPETGFATGVFTPTTPPVPPSGGQRLALRLLQVSLVAASLAASTHRTFELDRFFIPKELVLHLAALLVGLLCLAASRGLAWRRSDGLLVGFLILGAVSAVFAQNHWAAGRALAISVSGAVVFWSARSLARAGLGRGVAAGVGLAVVVAAATALAQAYGLRLDVFSINRAPGGTLGNRNFIAHACAFGLPVLFLCALRARRAPGFLAASAGLAAVAAILFLTRSRAAWLGAAAALAVFLAGWLISAPVRRQRRITGRLAILLLVAGLGVAAALLIPNRLRWNSQNPYAETAAELVNYQDGSGRGRLIQYRNSVRMAAEHPLLGVGPGNWPVVYPRYATRRDPSLDAEGMTANPWPSSDWAAFVSERGFLAAALLLGFLILIGGRALGRAARAAEEAEASAAVTLAATVAATLVVGAFDAVLLLGMPALIIWAALGALAGELPTGGDRPLRAGMKPILAILLIAFAGASAVRSAAQIAAMDFYEQGGRTALQTAARLDPGSYRIRMRLARAYSGRRNCAARREQADAAQALFPEADAPASMRRCRR